MFLSDLADEFLPGKADNMCRIIVDILEKIVEEYFTFVMYSRQQTHSVGPGYQQSWER